MRRRECLVVVTGEVLVRDEAGNGDYRIPLQPRMCLKLTDHLRFSPQAFDKQGKFGY
jgi:hypothetical protein